MDPQPKVEEVLTKEGTYTYALVDYFGGVRSVRFTGKKWECLALLTAATSDLQLAQA